MKNHFFFSYNGNKRDEVETIHDALKNNLKNISTIIEPFCGSSAFSFYIASLYPRRFNYVLNDNNKYLIELYTIAQSPQKFNILVERLRKLLHNINKEKYNAIVHQDNLDGYIIKNYIYAIRAGLFRNKGTIKSIDNFINAPIIQFLRTENIKTTNDDALQCYEKYKTNKNNFIFLDPPYVMLNNDFYANATLNIYEYLHHHNIIKEKAFIVLVLEWSWIIQLLFKDCKVITYKKKYQTSKKETVHAIIINKKT
jgi:site-specific DNA-adenine methylase